MGKYNIITEPTAKAVKFVFYGCEGIGKTTLASKLPGVVLIDTEGSASHTQYARYPIPLSWAQLMDMVNDVKMSGFKTLVIDTLDWADKLCSEALCAKNNWTSIETPGYGKGYTMLKEEFGKLLNALNDLASAGIHVGFNAHAQLRKIENPEDTGAYDHWEMKCSKQVAPLVREWCDMMVFCNFETVVTHGATKMDKNKVSGNHRMMYANHAPTFDAKNRFGLPDKMPLDYACLNHVFDRNWRDKIEKKETPSATTEAPDSHESYSMYNEKLRMAETAADDKAIKALESQKEDIVDLGDELAFIDPKLASLMIANRIAYAEIQDAVAFKGYYPIDTPIEKYDREFIDGWCVGMFDKVKSLIESRRNK